MAGIDAFGTTVSKGDGASSESFAAIGQATSVGGPELTRETYDVTAHDSTNGWREFIGGLKDGGEVSIDLNFDPAVHVPIATDSFDDDDPTNWEMSFPDGSAWEFAAILTSLASDAPHDGKLTGSISLKISGEPTFTGA